MHSKNKITILILTIILCMLSIVVASAENCSHNLEPLTSVTYSRFNSTQHKVVRKSGFWCTICHGEWYNTPTTTYEKHQLYVQAGTKRCKLCTYKDVGETQHIDPELY